jgi:hypothetical protein
MSQVDVDDGVVCVVFRDQKCRSGETPLAVAAGGSSAEPRNHDSFALLALSFHYVLYVSRVCGRRCSSH